MAKLKHLAALIFFLTTCCLAGAQTYPVQYIAVDMDSSKLAVAGLTKSFVSRTEANAYLGTLAAALRTKGFMTASIDSIQMDTAGAKVHLFLGGQYRWARISVAPEHEGLLQAARWPRKMQGALIDFKTLESAQNGILDYFEEQGYPFARVSLDSISIIGEEVSAKLNIAQGPLYKIDSIRVFGDARISNLFLQRYLELPPGAPYNKKKLQSISRKIAELTYVTEEKPSDLTLLGTGSVLNLYLKQKRSSQVNALVGILPNSNQLDPRKVLFTVDANILLRNALGNSEVMGFVWQQLQQRSPRLNIMFDQPYFMRTRFGLNFSFDMFRKDSAFLNIIMNLGTSYRIEERQTASVFLQRRLTQTILNEVNTASIVQSHRLPDEADVSSLNLGITYNFNNTNYRLNPRKGANLVLTTTAGNKRIKKNTQVLELKDPGDPSFQFSSLYDSVRLKAYQFRVQGNAERFLPIGRSSTMKLGLQAGIYQSANYFRNEMFQIGGYKTLRGFNEESQYVSQFAIGTLEYRFLFDVNSNFFAFVDGGWGNHVMEAVKHHGYFGTGMGLSLETKAGILSLVWAVGKRDDVQINLRQSKVHLGFVSYF